MPVTGVFVEIEQVDSEGLSGPVIATDLTDQRGYYRFYDLPNGLYNLYVSDSYLRSLRRPAKPTEHQRQILVSNSSFHQKVDLKCPPNDEGDWDFFDNLDGLPGYGFELLMDEPNGLWIFSHQWLRLYVGKEFKEITDIPVEWGNFSGGAAVPGGGLCIGSAGTDSELPALHFLNGKGIDGQLPTPDNLIPMKVAFGREGELYVLAENQLFELTDWKAQLNSHSNVLTWKNLKTPPAHDIAIGPAGEIWISGSHGVTRLVGTSLKNYDAKNGLIRTRINDLKIAKDGTAWIATTQGLGQLKNEQFHWMLNDGGPWGNLTKLEIGPNGDVWVGTVSSGVLKISSRGIFKNDDPNYEIRDTITGIAHGPGNTVFISTEGALRRYRPKRLEKFDEANGLPPAIPVLSIGASRQSDKIVIGTAWNGPQFLEGRKFESLPTGHLYGKSYVRAMGTKPDGKYWLCSNFGLSALNEFDIVPFETDPSLKLTDNYTACAFSANGEAWIGRGWAGGGVIRLEMGNGNFNIYGKHDGLQHENVWALDMGKDGKLRAGTEEGLFEFDGTGFVSPRHAGELKTLDVYGIESLQNGNLWVATSKGVYGLDSEKSFKLHIPGLPEEFMTWKVLVDSSGILWIATDAYGVIGFDGKEFTRLSMRQGLPSNIVYDIKEANHQRIWFATNGGVARLQRITYEPILTVDKITAGNVPVKISGGVFNITKGPPVSIHLDWVHLTSRSEELSIQSHGTHAETGRMERLPSPLNASMPLNWNPEQAGKYILEVTLRDNDFNSSKPVTLEFQVSLPWHKDPKKLIPLGGIVLLVFGGMSSVLLKGHLHRIKSKQIMELMLDKERELRSNLERNNLKITEMKEQAVKVAKHARAASRAKSLFVANMSHEIRTPLNAVIGYSQILKQDDELDKKHLNALSAIERSGQHLLRLIDDILELSQIESGRLTLKPVTFHLTEMIRSLHDIVSINCASKNLDWSVRWFEIGTPDTSPSSRQYLTAPPRSCVITEDESKLKQVLLNLLSNAVKFTRNGEVRLEIGLPCGWKSIASNSDKADVFFEVFDTGIGIAPEEQDSIMSPFSQGRDVAQLQGGVGLGLAISTRLVEAFGGELKVESKMGECTRFYFSAELSIKNEPSDSLPFRHRELQEIKIIATQAIHVLVVDDIETNRDVLVKILHGIGAKVVTAINGKEALEQVISFKPDIILLDIAMPDMDGFEVMRRIKGLKGSINPIPAVIAVTAGVMDRDPATYTQAGFRGFIPKPIQIAAINKMLLDHFSDHFEPAKTDKVDSIKNEKISINFDPETKKRLEELAKNYAVSEIVRLGEELMANQDPNQKAQAEEVIKLAKAGNLEELIQRLNCE
jgi:signal transduction histidine kinase/CheY-like chemotaxis protein/ligand-binding sensor domain-containing protein